MLKQILTSAALTTALVAGSAFAGGPDMPVAPECEHCFRPFLGVYYSYLDTDRGTFTAFDAAAFDVIFPGLTTASVVGARPDSFNGLGFMWGAKYGPFFGFAMGVNHYFEETNNVTVATPTIAAGAAVTYGVNTQGDLYFADARGYFPLMEGFDIIASVGAAFLDLVDSYTIPATVIAGGATTNFFSSGSELSWRVGAGFDYFFTPNWGIEAMFHYMPLSGNRLLVNDYWTVDAGINYMFS